MLQRKTLLIVTLLLLLLPAALQAQDDTVVIAVGIEPVSMDAWRGFAETGGPGLPERRGATGHARFCLWRNGAPAGDRLGVD